MTLTIQDNVCYDLIIRIFMILSIFLITIVKSTSQYKMDNTSL